MRQIVEVGVPEEKENSNNNNKTVKQIIVENFPKLMHDNKSQIQETQRTLSWRKKKITQALRGQIAKNQEKDKILKVAGGKKKNKTQPFCYCFNLHFPDDPGCETSFNMLICHLCIFFGEMSVQVLGPF